MDAASYLRHYLNEVEHKTIAMYTEDGKSSCGVFVPVHVLEAALEEIERRWIPVTERVPQDGADVIVVSVDPHGMCRVGFGWYTEHLSGGPQWFIGDNQIEVSHWQPIPEPIEVKR